MNCGMSYCRLRARLEPFPFTLLFIKGWMWLIPIREMQLLSDRTLIRTLELLRKKMKFIEEGVKYCTLKESSVDVQKYCKASK